MNIVVPVLVVLGIAALMGGFVWLTRHIKRRGLAGPQVGPALAVYEEVFYPSAHEARIEKRAQEEAEVESESGDGGPPRK